MLTPPPGGKILVGGAREIAQPFVFILHGMAVHNVHHHGDAHRVGLVHKRLQFLGRAETAARREETAHVIAETSIIRMLLHSHYLDAVVAQALHAGQDIVAELDVGAHLLRVLRHADVALIDEQGVGGWLELGHLPLVGILGSPCLRAEYLGVGILHHAVCPGGNALAVSAVPMDTQLEQAAMPEGLVLDLYFPVSRLCHTPHGMLGHLLPPVEVTYHIDACGVGGPLTQHPAVCHTVQTEIEIAVRKVGETAVRAGEMLLARKHVLVPAIDGICVFCQTGIIP